MKLSPSEIPGFLENYESPFPPAEMSGGVPGGAWEDMARVTAPKRSWMGASRLNRLSIGRIATTHGVLKQHVAAVKKIGDLGQLALGSEFVDAARSGAKIVGDLLEFEDALGLVASRVPVVGIYAQIAVMFVKFLRSAFTRGREAKLDVSKKAYDALGYNKEIDTDVANAAADFFGKRDWTKIFLPSWDPGDDFKLVSTSFVGNGTPDGKTLIPQQGALWQRGLGFVPGIGGRMVQWQWPDRVFGSARPSEPWTSIISIADLEPSVTQLTVLAWQMVLKNSANMFRVDAAKVRKRWLDYFGEMLEYADFLEGQDDDHAAQMVRGCATWIGREPIAGEGKFRVRDPFGRFKPNTLPAWVQPSRGSIIDYIVRTQLENSLKPALGTLTCAYVGPKFAGLENDAIREYWREMRSRLLEHDARYEVELDQIPDRDYRAAMTDATKQIEPRFAAPTKKGWDGLGQVDPDAAAPPTPTTVYPSLPGAPEDGDGALVAVAGGTLALLLLLL